MQRNVLFFIVLLFLSLSGSAQQNNVLFRRNGAGLWIHEGEKSELVVVMEMRREREDQVTLTVRPINGIPRRFTGTVSRRNPLGYIVTISKSGKAQASGTIYVENDASQSMRFLIGYAEVEGRRLAFHFTKDRPLRLNALLLGDGVFKSADTAEPIVAASVLTLMSGSSEISLLLENGGVQRYKASAQRNEGETKSADVRFALDSTTGSTGVVTAERSRTRFQFEKIHGEGESQGAPFSFSFTADQQLP